MSDWKFYGKCAACGAVATTCFCAAWPKVDDLQCLRIYCLPRPTLHAGHAHPEQPLPEWPQQQSRQVVATSTSTAAAVSPVMVKFPPPSS